MRKDAELLDLPTMDNQEHNSTKGLPVETPPPQLPDSIDIADMGIEQSVTETGLPVELPKTCQSSNPSEIRDTENTSMKSSNNNVGLRPDVNATENQNGLPVETVADTLVVNNAGKPTMDVSTTSENLMEEEPENNSETNNRNGLLVENNKNKCTTDAATGISMLESVNENNNALLEKYDNSKILPVDTVRQVDYGLDPNMDAPTPPENKKIQTGTNKKDDANSSYDSDDKILLEQEIAEVIGDQASELENKETSTPDRELPVETDTAWDTNSITDQLSNVRIDSHNGLPVETANTPTSPNRGKVVIKSYRLH